MCGWHQIGWKETKHLSGVDCTQQRSRFGRTNIFPRSLKPGMYSKTMWSKQRYCWQLQNHVRIQNFRRRNGETTKLGKYISTIFYHMEGHAKNCVERCCELASKTTHLNSLSWWPSIQRRRIRDAKIWENTVLKLPSLKTEIVRSARRPKITMAPCRRRIGRVVPRAENFRWLDNSRSQSSEWRKWISKQSPICSRGTSPCKTKTSQETERSLQTFLEPNRKLKVIKSDNSLDFDKACEDLSWNHCTSAPHRSETNGIAERTVCRVKEGTSAVLLQSGLDKKNGGRILLDVTAMKFLISRLTGRHRTKGDLENLLKDQLFHLVHWLNTNLFPRKTSRESISLVGKFCLEYCSDTPCTRGDSGKEREREFGMFCKFWFHSTRRRCQIPWFFEIFWGCPSRAGSRSKTSEIPIILSVSGGNPESRRGTVL